MSTPLHFDTRPCDDYVEDLSAWVDGEHGPVDADESPALSRLVEHMGSCRGCQDYTVTLRKLSELNRANAVTLDEETANRVDPTGLFAAITGDLVAEKRGTLARLFYEIGKAYALAGNRALQEKKRLSVAFASRALPIRGTEAKARRELRDAEALDRAGGRSSGTSILLRRSRQLFGPERNDSAALTRARRFLEEALALDPSLDEARIYLAFRHTAVGRSDRARIQLRKVYLDGRTPVLRLLALQFLGKLHAQEGDYRRAIECYEEVVSAQESTREPGLFPSFLNLAVNYAKAGDVDRATASFSDLAGRFPERLPQIRELLSRKSWFQAVLRDNHTLKRSLATRAPALFAA